jgi:CRP-like cAMP-binding protein
MDTPTLHSQNRLLAGLPAADFQLLCSRMRVVPLRPRSVLHEADGPTQDAFFPHAGAISLGVVLRSGQVVQTAVVGHEGTIGGIAALDGRIGCSRAEVHIEGTASSLYVGHLRQIAADSVAIRSMLLRYHEFLLCQAQWTAACNASHSLEQRLCRCLLRFRQVADKQNLALTQELLAELLGVKRTSVSLTAHRMQQAGVIRIRRGHTELLKLEIVQEVACECADKIQSHYDALFADAPKRAQHHGASG